MEDSFFEKLYPLQFVSRIVGLSPFSTKTKKLSPFWTFYSLLLTLSMISVSVYQLSAELTDKSNSKLFKFVEFVYIASPTISRTLTCLTFIVKYKLLLHFFEIASQIETVIKKLLNVPLPKKLYVKFQNLIVVMILIVEGIQMYLVLATHGLIPAVVRSFTIISHLCQAQFVCCVLLLNHYLTIIFHTLSNSKMADVFSNNQKLWPEICAKDDYEEKSINTCRELIRCIGIVKDDLNVFFSFPILLIIADSLVLITFNLYLLIKNLSLEMDSSEVLEQISFLYTVCVNMFQMFFIALPSAAPGKKIQCIADLAHNLINSKRYHESHDMVLLSKQLLHVEMIFTACGFFTLNESLITSVFAAISTQLVILLQFQMSSNED